VRDTVSQSAATVVGPLGIAPPRRASPPVLVIDASADFEIIAGTVEKIYPFCFKF
jgi:hypothetical protein